MGRVLLRAGPFSQRGARRAGQVYSQRLFRQLDGLGPHPMAA